ncbi:unnamed protein product, partial [marine sediment metagenome]
MMRGLANREGDREGELWGLPLPVPLCFETIIFSWTNLFGQIET